MDAFTDWASVPLVVDLATAARVLNVGRSTLYRRVTAGEFVPGLMPRLGQQRYQFSKAALQRYLDGGYAHQRSARR